MTSALAISEPTPIDAFERRDEWRFALVLLALVAGHRGVAGDDGSASTPIGGRTVPAARRATVRRGIRPPRSC